MELFTGKLAGGVVGVCVEFCNDGPCLLRLSVAEYCAVFGKLGFTSMMMLSMNLHQRGDSGMPRMKNNRRMGQRDCRAQGKRHWKLEPVAKNDPTEIHDAIV